VGVNVTFTVHVAATAIDAPFVHVVPVGATTNSDEFVPLIAGAALKTSAEFPLFVIVTLFDVLVSATCSANVRVTAERSAVGTGFTTVTFAVACAVAPLLSTTVSKTLVVPTGYGPAGLCVFVIASPSGSEEPLSIFAFAVPPEALAVTVTS
jgi:hypothetical protein